MDAQGYLCALLLLQERTVDSHEHNCLSNRQYGDCHFERHRRKQHEIETKLYAYNPTAAKVGCAGVLWRTRNAAVKRLWQPQHLFLAIKPQKFDEVRPALLMPSLMTLCWFPIAAGIGVEYIRKLTKPNAKSCSLPCRNTPLFPRLRCNGIIQKHRHRMQNLPLYAVFSMPAA